MIWLWIALGLLGAVVVYDVVQKKHAILRNFPVIGHFRYWLETIGPELRQYIVTNNDEERPFSRDQRRWIYASAKDENNLFGFGTDNDLELSPNHLILKHRAFPLDLPHRGQPGFDPAWPLPCAKVLGAARGRKRAFRPASVVNVSAMSFGSLSGPAIEALNRAAKSAGFLHCTGEGGISSHHEKGGDLIWQIGTGYFGCRDDRGRFSLERLVERVAATPTVRTIEVKLSQGAKPGKGGILPREKITPEIARIRGIPQDQDCISPSGHSAFQSVDEMLDFVESIAEATGLPVGIKSAVGDLAFWEELADMMARGDRGVDYIAVDGGEGGTGAAPLSFSDHVSLPFKVGFARVFKIFHSREISDDVLFVGSGRLGLPEAALFAFGLGCDMISVAREAMISIGCIQAQRCHTNHCPTGVATQNAWLARGLEPVSKAQRAARYVETLRREIRLLCAAAGYEHPALLTAEDLEILDDRFGSRTVAEVFGYAPGMGRPGRVELAGVEALMRESRGA